MNIVLEEYNKFAAKPLVTIQELEDVSEILHIDTVSEAEAEIVYKRYCSCCARDSEKKLHPVHYFAVDIGKCDENGDVDDLIPIKYGLL